MEWNEITNKRLFAVSTVLFDDIARYLPKLRSFRVRNTWKLLPRSCVPVTVLDNCSIGAHENFPVEFSDRYRCFSKPRCAKRKIHFIRLIFSSDKTHFDARGRSLFRQLSYVIKCNWLFSSDRELITVT